MKKLTANFRIDINDFKNREVILISIFTYIVDKFELKKSL